MPWEERSVEKQREELVSLALSEGVSASELCRRYGVSRETLYKWIRRSQADEGFSDRSRRPLTSPTRTSSPMEAAIVGLRNAHPRWGARKLRRLLLNEGLEKVPSVSTITEVLRRQGLLRRGISEPDALTRFEREFPNELWQMDFKGHFALQEGRCHPLTLLDDHSRCSMGIFAHSNERKEGVKTSLEKAFRVYGLPDSMLFDNGGPWGSPSQGEIGFLTVWLTLLGIKVSNGRPYHPQTQGKLERFHRTLKAEVLQGRQFATLKECQKAFDDFRHLYNHHRPHEALDLNFPMTRYRVSRRPFPEKLPEPEYASEYQVRKVQRLGIVHFKGNHLMVSELLRGQPVGLRQLEEDLWEVRFCARVLGQARLTQNPQTIRVTVRDVPEHL